MTDRRKPTHQLAAQVVEAPVIGGVASGIGDLVVLERNFHRGY